MIVGAADCVYLTFETVQAALIITLPASPSRPNLMANYACYIFFTNEGLVLVRTVLGQISFLAESACEYATPLAVPAMVLLMADLTLF